MTGRFDFDFCRHLNVHVIDEGKGCLQHSSYCLGSNLVIVYVTVLQGRKRLPRIGCGQVVRRRSAAARWRLLKYGFCNKSFRKDEPLTS